MVWKLKAEFLRRAITHEDRIRTLRETRLQWHTQSRGRRPRKHGQQRKPTRAARYRKSRCWHCEDQRQCKILLRHGEIKIFTKDLHGRKTVWEVRRGEMAAMRTRLDTSRINNNIRLYIYSHYLRNNSSCERSYKKVTHSTNIHNS